MSGSNPMSDEDLNLSPAQIENIHERVRRTVQAHDSSVDGDLDLEALSRIAANAYFIASRKDESLAQAEKRALDALNDASQEAERMKRYATWELVRLEEQDRGPDRGFLSDFVFSVLPAAIAGAAAWVAMKYSNSLGEALWALAFVAFGVAALAAVSFKRSGRAFTLQHVVLRSSLQHSGGAIVAGFVVLASAGVLGYAQIERRQTRELEANLQKWNQGLAVALAGAQAGATLSETQSALRTVTSVGWINLDSSPDGVWIASADSPKAHLMAQVRVSPASGDSAGLEVLEFATSEPGKAKPVPEYVWGKVVRSEFDKITLQLSNNQQRVITLPENTLAPAENSEVMAVLPRNGGKATFLQPIDGLVTNFAQ